MTIRSMTEAEEVNLATVVTAREVMGAQVVDDLAAKLGLPADLTDLARAGITYEEVDLLMEEEGEDGYRYVWAMPPQGEPN